MKESSPVLDWFPIVQMNETWKSPGWKAYWCLGRVGAVPERGAKVRVGYEDDVLLNCWSNVGLRIVSMSRLKPKARASRHGTRVTLGIRQPREPAFETMWECRR